MAFPIVNTRRRNLPGGAAELILGGGRTIAGGVQRHRDEQRAERLAGEERDFTELQRKKDRAHQLGMANIAHENAMERAEFTSRERGEQSRELAEFNAATRRQLMELRLGHEREALEQQLGIRREELDRRYPEGGGESAINPIDVLKLVTGGEPFEEEYHGEAFDQLMGMITGVPRRRLAMHPDDWEMMTGGQGGGRGTSAPPPDRRTPPPETGGGRADALGAPGGGAVPGGAAGPAGGAPEFVQDLDPAEIAEDILQLVPEDQREAKIEELPPGIREAVRQAIMAGQVRRGTATLPDSLRRR